MALTAVEKITGIFHENRSTGIVSGVDVWAKERDVAKMTLKSRLP